MKKLTIFTDGSSIGNPGPSGYAAILEWNGTEKEIAGGLKLSTNNRAEMYAAITALDAVTKNVPIQINTDSMYLIDGATKYLEKWAQKNWKAAGNRPLKNADLWEKIYLHQKEFSIEWNHVKAHSGIEKNERCDELAKKQAKNQPNTPDEGYMA